MSKFRVHKATIQSVDAILYAIKDRIIQRHSNHLTGKAREKAIEEWTEKADQIIKDYIQINLDEPMHLYGYKGDIRDELAHIRIPAHVLNDHMGGGMSNDAGFLFADDQCHAWFSDYDIGKWYDFASDRFWQQAATKEALDAAWLAPGVISVDVAENEKTGNIEIVCEFS
jgi:hypothetical protein